ncbi:MAG: twitch domain-containing radical SAM protein [Thermoanaerobaculia bacterium]
MSKTACIIPWSTLVIGTDGRASFCCDVPAPLTVDGRMGSVYRDSLDDLWNAPELVQLRSAMARGERPAACRLCWDREAAGGASRRLLTNAGYRQLGGQLAVEELSREGAGTDYRLERRPDWFILELGNVCNLKCRSCSPLSSSRIAADPAHSKWSDGVPAPEETSAVPLRPRLKLVPENSSAWFENIDAVADMIASGADGNAFLSIIGGEPFLIPSTWRLLEALVARGVAPHVFVGLLTNGQQRSTKLEELAPHFRGFNVSVSIDGYGRLYEYLRHGGSWRKLADTLRWLRHVPNLVLSAVPTFQNCNVLDIVTLLRFLDKQELPLTYNVVTWPARLSPANLPPSVRRIAAMRLRSYLDAECKPGNLTVVRNYCDLLEEAGDDFDADLFGEFMTFTNDLDASRGESLGEAAPELVALIRAAGVDWSHERRHVSAPAVRSTIAPKEVLERVRRTVSAHDVIFGGFEAVERDAYFSSAVAQLVEIDGRLRERGHPGLAGSRAVVDFACHYGRLTRALVAALPHTSVYACDIDRDAVRFCADELGALPVVTGWRPDEDRLPGGIDIVFCVSLLTHTPLEHWRRVLRAWAWMLRPGGVAAFTFLSERHVDPWLAGTMDHYGSYSGEVRDATARSLREEGHGFASLTSSYGDEPLYGIAFVESDVVRREIIAAGLELLELPHAVSPIFGQDLALVRKPGEKDAASRADLPSPRRDVSLVALYDPRCFSPESPEDGSPADSTWARLAATPQPRALPTELNFADPRVPEVREAQSSLAREHGVDAFCFLYRWGAEKPRWDAPWRDLVASGRPDFPFCLMVAVEDGEPMSTETAARLIDEIAPGLQDRRYLRVEGRGLVIVRDVGRLREPHAIARAWRAGAAARGLGEIHLCAAEPVPADCPEDLGFDSFLETQTSATSAADYADTVSAALTRPWPRHRFFRTVRCRRDAGDPRSAELYEHWLRSAVDATRRRGQSLVFVNAWNDWLGGAYLEPDDRDGRAALLATRRAARGPASGLVLLRRLRDELGELGGPASEILGDLEQVLALHEHTRDRLLASVEVALGRMTGSETLPAGSETLRWVPVSSRQLPPSGGGFSIDRVGNIGWPDLQDARDPIPLDGDRVFLAGWANIGNCAPYEVDLFLAFESIRGAEDRVFRIWERSSRPDVVAAFPGHPTNCGFGQMVDVSALPPGNYHIAIIQRAPNATYRDVTRVTVQRDGAPCSSA